MSRNQPNNNYVLQIGNMTFKKTKSFKHLGTLSNSNNIIKDEIQARIQAANKSFYGLQNLLSSKILSRKAKVSIYKTVIQPILLYGSETCSTTNKDVMQIQVFENNVVRKYVNLCKATGKSRRIYNKELY